MTTDQEVDNWLESRCRVTKKGLVWPNGTLHSWGTSREIVRVYLALGLEPSTGLVTIDLMRALLQRIEGLEQMFTALGAAPGMPDDATKCSTDRDGGQ